MGPLASEPTGSVRLAADSPTHDFDGFERSANLVDAQPAARQTTAKPATDRRRRGPHPLIDVDSTFRPARNFVHPPGSDDTGAEIHRQRTSGRPFVSIEPMAGKN
jgi:hypothetical protein